jgi:mRNA interferase YafQ
MYDISMSVKFKRDLKAARKRGLDLDRLNTVVDLLAVGSALPAVHKDHSLTGDYGGFRECHIAPDWLLIYRVDKSELVLYLMRTGTHSDLF